MCGIDGDLTPGIDNEDVDGDNALPKGVAKVDGEDTLHEYANPDGKGTGPYNNPYVENFDARHFPDVFNDTVYISNDSPPSSDDQIWRDVGNKLHTATGNFERELRSLKTGSGWEGRTIEAAFDNAIQSVNEPFYTGTAALRAAQLTRKWREVVQYVMDNLINDPKGEFDSLLARYNHDLEWKNVTYAAENYSQTVEEHTTEADKEEVRQQYDEYMRIVMNKSYSQGTEDIWGNYPQFVDGTGTEKPSEIPGLPQKPSKPGDDTGGPKNGGGGTPSFGGGTPSFGGGTPSLGGAGMSIPKTPGTSLPEGLPKPPQTPGDPTTPGQSTGSPTDPSQAIGPASGLASGAGQALGSAMQAAKAAPGGPPKSPGPKPKMPEGALQLGKGAKGSGAGGTGGGKGGASLGGVPKGLPSGLPGQPTAATQAAAAKFQPGVGAGAGMGPPGTPGGAGHGAGGAQQGKEHKLNKALRSRKKGAEIAGEAEAVVPVIGQDQDQDHGEDRQEDRHQRDDLGQVRPDVRSGTPPGPAERGRGVRAH